MGELLYTPTWNALPEMIVERNLLWGFAIGWWEHCALSLGMNSRLREVPFGGYKVQVGVSPAFWNASSSAWFHADIIADIWAEAPASGVHINAGSVERSVQFDPDRGIYLMVIRFACTNARYTFHKLPEGEQGTWYTLPEIDLPSSFRVEEASPAISLPTVWC